MKRVILLLAILVTSISGEVVTGTIDTDTTWSDSVLVSSVIIGSGATVTIEPGTVVTSSYGKITVKGAIKALGAKDDSIKFMGNGTGLYFQTAVADSSIFEYCLFFGAKEKGVGGAFNISSSNKIRISHSLITQASAYQNGAGMYIYNSTVLLEYVDITNCMLSNEPFNFRDLYGSAIYAEGSTLLMGNCELKYNSINTSSKDGFGAGIYANSTNIIETAQNKVHYNSPNNSYLFRTIKFENDTTIGGTFIHNGFTVAKGATITFLPGTVVKGYGDAHIVISGNMIARGTATDSIIFTNVDSTEMWGGLRFTSNESTVIADLSHVVIENAQQAKVLSYAWPNGAIEVTGHRFNMSNSVIRNCLSEKGKGGAIYFNTIFSHSIDNCIFENSSANRGGAIYSVGTDLSISNSKFINHANVNGGTVYQEKGNITVDNTSFTKNMGEKGLYLYVDNATYNCKNIPWKPLNSLMRKTGYAKPLIYAENSSGVVENSALIGVDSLGVIGFYAFNSHSDIDTLTDYSLKITNSLIKTFGMYSQAPTAHNIAIKNSTLTNPEVTSQIRSDGTHSVNITIKNSIFTYVKPSYSDPIFGFDAEYSNIFSEDSVVTAGNVGINGNINEDPQFVDPLNNDYHLQISSSSVNTGSPDFSIELKTDLDGNERVYGNRIDMGAYENQGTSAVEDEYIPFPKAVIYPNPVQSRMNVDANLKGDMFIYNESGKMVFSGFSGSIDVVSLPKGVYFFVMIDGDGQKFYQKFYKE